MENSLTIRRKAFAKNTVAIFITVISAVALPQVFHAVGAVSGLGTSLGSAFLPMHLPVMIAGLLAGPITGLIAGLLSPVISFAISVMPTAEMLLFMTVELAGYGLAAGLLRNIKMPTIFKALIIQIAGRLFRTAAILIAIYGFQSSMVGLASIWNSIVNGLPGLILQWALIPLFVFRIEKGHE